MEPSACPSDLNVSHLFQSPQPNPALDPEELYRIFVGYTLCCQAARAKNRRTAAKDRLPDEVFLRLRGSLFFGPSFLVTRNKLTFRDNLQQLLADATPGR